MTSFCISSLFVPLTHSESAFFNFGMKLVTKTRVCQSDSSINLTPYQGMIDRCTHGTLHSSYANAHKMESLRIFKVDTNSAVALIKGLEVT